MTGYLFRFERPLREGDVVARDSMIRARHVLPIVREGDPSSAIGRTMVLIRDDVGVWMEGWIDAGFEQRLSRLVPHYVALTHENGRPGRRRVHSLRLLRAELA